MMDINTTTEEASLKNITDALDGISYKAPTILKNAANATGKVTMKRLQEKMDKKYDITSDKINLKNSMRRVSATYANPRTIIEAKSPMYSLGYFQVTPRRLAYGKNRPKIYRGAVLKSEQKDLEWNEIKLSGGKKLKLENGKGFYVRFENGHEDIALRFPGTRKIFTVPSPSIPGMSGVTYREEVEEDAVKLMREKLQYEIERFLKARDKA